MIRYILIVCALITGCGRKKNDVQKEQDLSNLNKVQSYTSYDWKNYRNSYLAKRIKDVSFAIKDQDYTQLITVEVTPLCHERALQFVGFKPNGPYTSELELVRGSTNINVNLICTNNDCSDFIIDVREDREGEKGIYPVVVESKNELPVKTWSPNKKNYDSNRDLNGENLCLQNEVSLEKTINLFVDFDDADDNLGFIEKYEFEPQEKAARARLYEVCENELQGSVVTDSLGTIVNSGIQSLRWNLGTYQFEYDDFVIGQCKINHEVEYKANHYIDVFEKGVTKESAYRKALKHCVDTVKGTPSSSYARDVQQQDLHNWVAKVRCELLRGEEALNL